MTKYRVHKLFLSYIMGSVILLNGCAHQTTFPVGTYGWILNDLEIKAKSMIDHTQNAANNVVNNAAYNAINAIVQAREEFDDALDKTAREATIQQRLALEGIKNLVEQLFDEIETEHNRIDDTLDNMAVYLSDTIFVSGEPRISRFNSNVAVHGSTVDSPLLIDFKGKALNDDRNHLIAQLDEKIQLEPVETSDNHLSFMLDRDRIAEFSSDDDATPIFVELALFQHGFLSVPIRKTYKYRVLVLPELAGSCRGSNTVGTPRLLLIIRRKHAGGPTGSFRSGRNLAKIPRCIDERFPRPGGIRLRE